MMMTRTNWKASLKYYFAISCLRMTSKFLITRIRQHHPIYAIGNNDDNKREIWNASPKDCFAISCFIGTRRLYLTWKSIKIQEVYGAAKRSALHWDPEASGGLMLLEGCDAMNFREDKNSYCRHITTSERKCIRSFFSSHIYYEFRI